MGADVVDGGGRLVVWAVAVGDSFGSDPSLTSPTA
jgi:hypothetical protein